MGKVARGFCDDHHSNMALCSIVVLDDSDCELPLRLKRTPETDSDVAWLLEPRRVVHRTGHWRELRDKVPIPQ
jgi:hypothetical protein